MTDNATMDVWNFNKMVAINIGSTTFSKEDVLAIDDLINRQKAEIEEQDSEIARLKGILDCYARQYGTVRCYTEGKDED